MHHAYRKQIRSEFKKHASSVKRKSVNTDKQMAELNERKKMKIKGNTLKS